ncbi:MAG: YhdP family protein [Wenzhouxiangella sp.]|jgi:uncharacterized protein (TIGR02099 family)|nr:YhdP family protein [Wenzhouxiangella sp.]
MLARQFRDLLLTTLALVIISTAVLVGIGRTLLPHADELRPWLERQLSQRVGQTVTLDRVEAQWPRLTPSLTLIGLKVGDDRDQGLEIDTARLELHLPNLFDADANLMRLVVLGLEVLLAPDEGGRWGVELAAGVVIRGTMTGSGLPGADVLLRDTRLRIRPRAGPELALRVPEGWVRREGDRTLIHGSLQPGRERVPVSGIRLRLDHPDGRWQAAEGWLGIDDLVLADWLPALDPDSALASTRASLESWVQWSAADQEMRLDLDFQLRDDSGPSPLTGRATVVRTGQIYQAQVERLALAGETIGEGLALAHDGRRWALAVDALDLAATHAALAPWLGTMPGWPESMSGQVHDLQGGMDEGWSVHAAEGRIEQLSFALAASWPSVEGLDLRLDRLGDRLVIVPSGQPLLNWPGLLRGEVRFDDLAGQVIVARDSVELRGFGIDSAVAAATADGWIYLEQPRPFLDLFIRADRVGPIDPRRFLPHRIIPRPAMRWLDQSLVWVEDARGYVNLHLRAGTRTRDLHPGAYQAHVDFRDVDLDYWPEWPVARGLQGQAEFIGRRLSGHIERARVGEINVAAKEVQIADLAAPELVLNVSSSGSDAGHLSTTLSEIPFSGWQAVLAPMRWSGPIDLDAVLTLPFRRMRDWNVDGSARLIDASLELPAIDTRLTRLSASVAFDRAGIEPVRVETYLVDQPLELNLAAGFESPAWLELSAPLNPASLVSSSGLPGALGRRTSGRSHWRYRLEGRNGEGIRMSLASDLKGMALDWPAPFSKSAEAVWPLEAELLLGDGDAELSFRLDRLVAGRLALGQDQWSASLAFGDPPSAIPLPAGLMVSGEVGTLGLDDWFGVLEQPNRGTGLAMAGPIRVALSADSVELAGIRTGAARLTVDRTDTALSFALDSAELAGTLTVPVEAQAGRAVVADLARVHFPSGVDQALAEELQRRPSDGSTSRFSPAGLAPFSMVIEDLRRGELELGRMRLEAHPIGTGLEMELLDISGPDLRLQGSGRWIDTADGPRSQFAGRISTPSLSALLNSAGYDPGIEAARAQVDLDVQWPGGPADFSLSRLLGRLDLQIGDGQIPEARPGAGRLLGLVSFNAIPRRLMLDFRDVFSPGMRFDAIEGVFDLAAGVARTNGLVLRSPAAVMTISGQTDMVAREYDQTLRVEPGLGASLPVIGGLAGGPIGAAAGLVLRQLLERPLRDVAEVRYRITGPWDSPQIELVDARVVEQAASDPPPEQD